MSEHKTARNIVNALLYSIENLTAILFTIVSASLIARHFGPEIFSRYSVVQSVSTVLLVIVTLGLDQFVIREMVRNIHDKEYVTSVQVGFFLGWLLYVFLILLYYLLYKDFARDLFLIVNVVISIFFLKVIFIRSYLQAINRPRSIAIASVVSRIISVLFLFGGAYFDFSFNAMMMYLPIQSFILILVMTLMQPDYFRLINIRYFNMTRLVDMTREAFPVFISTLLYFFYSQSDVLIMAKLLDPATVGTYSAAIRIIPQAAFIGQVLVATFYTGMDKELLRDHGTFLLHIRSLLAIHFMVGIVMSACVFFSSGLIVHLLYGARYAQSAPVLAVSCWAWVFILPGALYGRLLIMLGYVKYALIKMLIVAPVVLVMNYWVTQQFGMIGCAVVCVLSYLLVDFVIYFLFKDTRELAKIGMLAIADIIFKPRQTFSVAVSIFNHRH